MSTQPADREVCAEGRHWAAKGADVVCKSGPDGVSIGIARVYRGNRDAGRLAVCEHCGLVFVEWST